MIRITTAVPLSDRLNSGASAVLEIPVDKKLRYIKIINGKGEDVTDLFKLDAKETERRGSPVYLLRPECEKCNHLPVCKDELKQNREGYCPFFENART